MHLVKWALNVLKYTRTYTLKNSHIHTHTHGHAHVYVVRWSLNLRRARKVRFFTIRDCAFRELILRPGGGGVAQQRPIWDQLIVAALNERWRVIIIVFIHIYPSPRTPILSYEHYTRACYFHFFPFRFVGFFLSIFVIIINFKNRGIRLFFSFFHSAHLSPEEFPCSSSG